MKIDIDSVIEQKNPRLNKLLPRFVKSYIKRIIHQDEINYCLENFGNIEGVEFISAIIDYMGIKYEVKGAENIEHGKRYIVAANHPLGGMDGMILAKVIDDTCGDVKLVVNDILMNLDPIKPIFVPVNAYGKQSLGYAQSLNNLYESSANIIYFPAGYCSRKIDGVIQDTLWKKSFLVKAIEHRRDIVPVYVDAHNSKFFYNLSSIRKKIGIKANLEMFYLADEMFRQKGKKITIVIGKPISYTRFTKENSLNKWVEKIREKVYSLAKK